MAPAARRTTGVVLAFVALTGGVWLGERALAHARETRRAAEEQRAAAAEVAAADAVALTLQGLEGRAAGAASLQSLQGMAHNRVNGATFADFFQNEAAWAPFRAEFPATAIFVGAQLAGASAGTAVSSFNLDALLRDARAKGLASGALVADGKAFLAGAAKLPIADLPGQPAPTLVVLVKPLDSKIVEQWGQRARGAVLLSAGDKVLALAGPEDQQTRLTGWLADGPAAPHLAVDGSAAAAVKEIAPGLWLWISPEPSPDAETSSKQVAWGFRVLGLTVGLAALLISWRSPASTTTEQLRTTQAQLAQSQAALARLSSAIRTPGADAAPDSAMISLPLALSQTMATTLAPTPFGRYQLIHLLGEGGMARVYLAIAHGAEGFRRLFVVKRLRAELSHRQEIVDQFIDEARLGSSLVHSNIVPIFDFGKEGDEYFLAQEYILGRDLDFLRRRSLEKLGRPLDEEAVLFIAHETLKALAYAHARTDDSGRPLGIVHRDISPNNIMVTARGEVKLLDFGIVKAEGRLAKTDHGVVKGNVYFMSPEQARGGEVDPRADLFSLALTLFAIASEDTLYQGTTSYDLLVKAAGGLDAADWERVRGLPPRLVEVLSRALQTDREDRFRSAEEFLLALPAVGARASVQLRELIQSLFADEFRVEQGRFALANEAGTAPLAESK